MFIVNKSLYSLFTFVLFAYNQHIEFIFVLSQGKGIFYSMTQNFQGKLMGKHFKDQKDEGAREMFLNKLD